MEWSSYGPIILAVVLFLLVGTIIERRIEVVIRRVLEHHQAQVQACQTSQSTNQQTSQTSNQQTNQQGLVNGQTTRTTSDTFTCKSAMTSISSVFIKPALTLQKSVENKLLDHPLKSALKSKSNTFV